MTFYNDEKVVSRRPSFHRLNDRLDSRGVTSVFVFQHKMERRSIESDIDMFLAEHLGDEVTSCEIKIEGADSGSRRSTRQYISRYSLV
jgi:hypothetical protein